MSAIRLSFVNQKGGIGKTTLSCLFASAIHFGYKNIRVAIIDIDPQQSLSNSRNVEASNIVTNEDALARYLEALEKAKKNNIYDIISAPLGLVDIGALLESYDDLYDYILLEVPSNINAEYSGLDDILKMLDFVFVPFNPSEYVVSSTLKFLDDLTSKFINKPDCLIRATAMVNVFYPLNDTSKEAHSFVEWGLQIEKKYNIPTLKENLKQSLFFKNITNPLELLGDAKTNLGLNVDDASKTLTEGIELMFDNKSSKKYVNTLYPFPQKGIFNKINPYPLIKEIIDFMNKNIRRMRTLENLKNPKARNLKKVIDTEKNGSKNNFVANEATALKNLLKSIKTTAVTEDMIHSFKDKLAFPLLPTKEDKTGKSISIEVGLSKRINQLALALEMDYSQLISRICTLFFEPNIEIIKEIIKRDSQF